MDDALTFESLFAGAKKFAHEALEAHRDEDEELFVLHAGVSIERLVKAALARANPMLLMEPGIKEDHVLLHFAGVRDIAGKVRTISASQALARARSAGWLSKSAELDELLELRNGVAHLGPAGPQNSDILATFVGATMDVLRHLAEDPDSYWGDWKRTVYLSLNDKLERVERDVFSRIERHRHRYQEKIRDWPAQAVAYTRADAGSYLPSLITTMTDGDPVVIGRAKCPACVHSEALILFNMRLLGDMNDPVETEAACEGFICPLCHLNLKGFPEVLAAGLNLDGIAIPVVDSEVFDRALENTVHGRPGGMFDMLASILKPPEA